MSGLARCPESAAQCAAVRPWSSVRYKILTSVYSEHFSWFSEKVSDLSSFSSKTEVSCWYFLKFQVVVENQVCFKRKKLHFYMSFNNLSPDLKKVDGKLIESPKW